MRTSSTDTNVHGITVTSGPAMAGRGFKGSFTDRPCPSNSVNLADVVVASVDPHKYLNVSVRECGTLSPAGAMTLRDLLISAYPLPETETVKEVEPMSRLRSDGIRHFNAPAAHYRIATIKGVCLDVGVFKEPDGDISMFQAGCGDDDRIVINKEMALALGKALIRASEAYGAGSVPFAEALKTTNGDTWEGVAKAGADITRRIKVPGGWLYSHGSSSIVFVPDADK